MVGFGGLLVSHHTCHAHSAELVGAQATLRSVGRHPCVMATRGSCNCVALPQSIALQSPAHQHHDTLPYNVECSNHALSKQHNTTHMCKPPDAQTQVPPEVVLAHTLLPACCSASGLAACKPHHTDAAIAATAAHCPAAQGACAAEPGRGAVATGTTGTAL